MFADIFNGFLFYEDEKNRIDPDLLEDLPTEGIFYDTDGNIRNMYQDVFKKYGNQHFALVSLGLENQATIERSMPIRILEQLYEVLIQQTEILRELTAD